MTEDSQFQQRLQAVVTQRIAHCRGFIGCDRLSGGASQETYRIAIETDGGSGLLAMRRAPGGLAEEVIEPGKPGLEAEAQLFQLALAGGVPVPEVYYVLTPEDGLGRGFIMQWLEGEALGSKIARSEDFADIRPQLAYQCGQTLARIHRLDVTAALSQRVLEMSPELFVNQTWDRYKAFDNPQPMIDYTGRWLLDNLPLVEQHTLVHNDFRNGNIMMSSETGITAVLDWELAHIGDPMRDLGWLCCNSWRFGVTELPVGGFGLREELFAGYQAESGREVDPAHVKFWEVFGSFWWSVGCLGMAEHYRNGPDASVERPAIGRRSSECQVDCVNLLIPGAVSVPSGEALALSATMPSSTELLESVRDFMRTEVMAETAGRTQFLSRVAANSLDIVLRELQLGPDHQRRELAALEQLLSSSGSLEALRGQLALALREGSMDLNHTGLAQFLRDSVVGQIAIDQPKYSGFRSALNFTE